MGKVGRKSNPKTMQDKRKTYGEKIVKKKENKGKRAKKIIYW